MRTIIELYIKWQIRRLAKRLLLDDRTNDAVHALWNAKAIYRDSLDSAQPDKSL